jgi:hypothetical protein
VVLAATACQPSADEIRRRAAKADEESHAAAVARDAERKQKEKDQAEAEAKRQEQVVARDRCPYGPGRRVGETEFRTACKMAIKRQLLSPKSADFPGMFDEVSKVDESSTCSRTWRTWVDAKNAYGVAIRHNFTCSYDSAAGTVGIALESL